MTILCALTQKRTILFSTILFWVSAQSIVKTPSKFLKLGTHRADDQPPKPGKFSLKSTASVANVQNAPAHKTPCG